MSIRKLWNDEIFAKTFRKVFKAGYSRFPVYDQTDIKGIVSVKDLLCINQDDDVPMKTFFELFGRPVEVVSSDQPLDEVRSLLPFISFASANVLGFPPPPESYLRFP